MKNNIYFICITESLCCTPETNTQPCKSTILQLSFKVLSIYSHSYMRSYIYGKEASDDISECSYMIRSIICFAKITIMIQDCRISLMKLEIKLVSTQSYH